MLHQICWRIRRRPAALVLPCLAVVLLYRGGSAIAANIYWDSNGTAAGSDSTTGTWDKSSTLKWTTDGALGKASPGTYSGTGGGTGNDVVFSAGASNSSTLVNTVNVNSTAGSGGAIPVHGIIVKDGLLALSNSNAGDFQIYAGGITIGTTAVTNNASGVSTLGANILFEIVENQAWTNNISDNLLLKSNIKNRIGQDTVLTLNAASSGNIVASSGISNAATGSLGLQVNSTGSGTVTLSNGNSYTAGTSLTAGKVIAANSSAFGSSSGASVLSIQSATVDLAIDIPNSLNPTIDPYNTLITGNATVLSDLAVAGAGVKHTLGTLKVGSNTFTAGGGTKVTSGTAGLAFGAVTLTGTPVFNVTNPDAAATTTTLFLGPITGNDPSFGLTKTGSGTLSLSGANAYTGKTTINSGVVTLGSGATLNSATAVVMGGATKSAATLNVSGSGANVTVAGLTGTGTIQLASGQQLILTSTGTLNTASSIDTLVFTGGGTTGGLTLGGTTAFDINLSQLQSDMTAGTYTNTDTLTLAGQTLRYNGVINLNFTGSTTTNETFHLVNFGSMSGAPTQVNFSGLAQGRSATFNAAQGLVVVTVPEPSSLFVIGAGISLLRRRRR